MLEYLGYYLAIGIILNGLLASGPYYTYHIHISTIVAWPIVLGIYIVKGLAALIKE